MRFFRMQTMALALGMVALGAFFFNSATPVAHAQTNITGAIAGTVSDATGAIVPGAVVTITDKATGSSQVVKTSATGDYRISQLTPGEYSVSVTGSGFETSKQTVLVSLNTVAAADFKLTVGKNTEVLEVAAGEVQLLHTEDAQVSTQFTLQQIQNLPNPGNDLTFVAQTAAGSVMNTQSEYGNFSSFGLPGTANSFTINGGYDNDPFMNISNSGATNLLLGANDVANETVTTNAYNASFGGLGGAQVSQTSHSGSNQFHGNAVYQWNGRVMNANDFFNKLYGDPRSFDNANQYAASVGGPIKRNKAFFFFNYEGLKVVLPTRTTAYAPDATYQSTVLANLVTNGLSSETAVYQNIFNLYNNSSGFKSGAETAGCGADIEGSDYPYCTWTFNGTAGNYTHEWLMNPRIDWKLSEKDNVFAHGTIDKGVQATYTSVLNPLFNALSPQPSYESQIGEEHTFSPTVTNQFLSSMIYYVAVFSNTNEAASEKLVPFSLIFADGLNANNAAAAWPGGYNLIWPQGRNVTGYTFQDDLTWIKGKHTMSFGWTMRRDDITDYSPSEYTTSPEAYTTNASFEQGYVDYWQENFPSRPTQPVALYAMGWYAQDQWKLRPNLTVTYGLRMEHNSDPICRTNCFAHLSGNFGSVSTSSATPYNKLIDANLGVALPSLQKIGWEPRIGFSYLPFGPGSRTTIRSGFGMFADAFPGLIADDLLNNAPTNVPFSIYGPAFGGPNATLVPSAPGSSESLAVASDQAFASAFSTGGSFNTISDSVNGFSAPNVYNPATKIDNPTYEEWSFAVEQQVSRFDSFQIMYVGNRSYHDPELNSGINAYNAGGVPGFPELPAAAPNPNFGVVTEVTSSSSSNYNGLILSVQHRSGSLTLNVNYEWSHALDDISNGGFLQFSPNSVYPDNPYNLKDNYGNADYDTRQYVSGNYVYSMPHFKGPRVLVDNWQVSGTVFHSTGLPFSVLDDLTTNGIGNYIVGSTPNPLYAKQIAPIKGHTHCGGKGAATGTPCAFAADYGQADDFGESRRNQLFGPNYTDSDFTVTKGFLVPRWEAGKLRVGAQFFNLFNHPNFAQPYNTLSSGSAMGTIPLAVNPPTSILGSFLGGDASPRLVQLTLKFDF